MFTISEILDIAIRFEENGAEIYRQALKRVQRPELEKLLEWMIAEEMRHADWFRDLKDRIARPSANPIIRAMTREMLDEMVGQQSFSLKEVDFSRIDDADALLDTFVEFEQDTILFYEMLEAFIEDDITRSQLRLIIDEEERHVDRLQSLIPA